MNTKTAEHFSFEGSYFLLFAFIGEVLQADLVKLIGICGFLPGIIEGIIGHTG